MSNEASAPTCIVQGCEKLSALSSTAEDQFFSFTTFYCADHYEGLTEGGDFPLTLPASFLSGGSGMRVESRS